KISMRHTNDGRLHHAGLFVDDKLYLLGIDIVSTGDDQILVASDNGHDIGGDIIAAVATHVAGSKPAIAGELFAGFFGHAPVTGEDVGALDLDVADLAGDHHLVVIVDDTQRNARQGSANRARQTLAIAGMEGIGG